MAKTNWKTLCAGVVVAISGIVGFTSCENKNEKQGEKGWPNTENTEKDVSAFDNNFKAENKTHYTFTHEKKLEDLYKDEYIEVKFDHIMPDLNNENNGYTYGFKTPKMEEKLTVTDNTDFNKRVKDVSQNQSQPQPEKKEPPKGSISKDAFINALLERNNGRNGVKK